MDREGDRLFGAQTPGTAVALLVSIVIFGAVGYHLIEGWSLWRAL